MRAVRVALWVAGTTAIAVGSVLGALWFWSSANTSLATALAVAAQWLPAGQTLQTRNVQGSVRGGGSVEWLRWQQGALSVEVHDLRVHWALRSVLDGEARVDQLAARLVHIEDRRPAAPPGASKPLNSLVLPVKVDTHVSIATLEWQGSTTLVATDLAGHYIFDSATHRLNAGHGRISSGKYDFSATLQATAPMALAAQVQGTVQTTLPGRSTPWEIPAQASATGTLAGADATLDLAARLSPPSGNTMQAQFTARVQPWQAQPVVQAQASWQGLDLAAVWPQAPQARLSGTASVTPAGTGWHALLQVDNALAGPWDRQRLPLEHLDTELDYGQGQWTVRALQATGAGGRLQAQGQADASNPGAGWQGQAKVQGVNTAALDSRLASTVLDGQLTAQHSDAGITFKAEVTGASGPAIRSAKPNTNSNGIRLQKLTASGIWKAPQLVIDSLALQTDDAKLDGQLSIQTSDRSASGELAMSLPGAIATARGQLSSAQGDGKLHLQVSDATLLSRWLARLPGASAAGARSQIKGEATLDASWQGGWHDAGQALEIRATGRIPKLEWLADSAAAAAPWRLRDGQLDVSGTLAALNVSTQGQMERDTQRLSLQAGSVLSRVDDTTWQAHLDTLQVTAQDRRRAGVWALRLAERVSWMYQQTATRRSLDSTSGTLRLTGPHPGTALLNWQSARWAQTANGGQWQSQWNTQGRLSDLPLGWLEAFSPTLLADAGLRGDVVFGGQWDVQSSEGLRVRAYLERTAGDLQLLAEGDDTTLLSAGLRTARLEVSNDNDQLSATLRWDSERAGQLQADFGTRLQHTDGIWSWGPDAPLSGQLKAQLPRVGAWSVLAPPGWRLRGTLDADATLSGSRKRPLWRGQLGAKDLALRSVVDGIDFSGGTLRTRLEGERLDIEEFTLQGAGGSAGGLLSATGFAQWTTPEANATGQEAPLLERLRLEMDATAKALRVTARGDRRLVLSGNLSARLLGPKLAIRGALKADQALFVMPEDSAPRLSDDVVVRKPVVAAPAAVAVRAVSTPSGNGATIQPDFIITLDLGQDFQVRGSGLSTLLEGSVELRNAGRSMAPRLSGTLRTAQGTYKAYGQQLDIEEGVLRFTGPYDNPSLDILAIRPNLTQRVGVQISGTALLPIVRLYADPDLADSEKLAWLVLGRSGANGGAESAMLQQAALALIGSKGGATGGIADVFGLDEISLRGGSNGDVAPTSGSSTGATGATVTLGKRLSRDFYVAYERSLAGTVGTLSIFYDLSRRFTLRGQTGEQSAVDLIFTLRYD
jgi:translocation and assembly module TamB